MLVLKKIFFFLKLSFTVSRYYTMEMDIDTERSIIIVMVILQEMKLKNSFIKSTSSVNIQWKFRYQVKESEILCSSLYDIHKLIINCNQKSSILKK